MPRCSPGKATYPCYPGYYPQLSPGKHPAYTEAAHQAAYPGYSGDTAAEYIQPCHIFQVSAAPRVTRVTRDSCEHEPGLQMDHYEYKADQQQGLEAGGVMTGAVEAAQYSPAQYSSPPPLYHQDTGLQPASVAGHQHHSPERKVNVYL